MGKSVLLAPRLLIAGGARRPPSAEQPRRTSPLNPLPRRRKSSWFAVDIPEPGPDAVRVSSQFNAAPMPAAMVSAGTQYGGTLRVVRPGPPGRGDRYGRYRKELIDKSHEKLFG